MELEQPDSLDGWVAIRHKPFHKTEPPIKLQFHIGWNSFENKIAVTCLKKSRSVNDSQNLGWSGVFSFHELQSIHDQLCLVHPEVEPYLPLLPIEPRGLWAYFTTVDVPDDTLCLKLTQYFQVALDICGQQLLISTLFEDGTCEHYFESISELKRKFYDEAIRNAEEEMQSVLFHRDGSINMCDISEVYELEDAASWKLNLALAQLYNYMLQPFLDMRELAYSKVREAKQGLQNPNFGERRKKEFATMFTEWQENYVKALDRIQELYIEYYTKTVEITEAAHSRMQQDKRRFGKASFQLIAMSRMHRVLEELSQERLQLLGATKKHYEHQRDKIKQEIGSLDERPGGIQKELTRLEKQVYRWQVRIYDTELESLDEEEQMYRRRMDAVVQETQAKEVEIEFFDAVEDQDDLEDDLEENSKKTKQDPRITSLKQKLAKVNRRRAHIRNKKKSFVREEENKKQKKQEIKELHEQHHQIQKKRDARQEDLNQKQSFIQEERKKTMERLKQFKMKYPTPATIRPPRYQPPSQRRRAGSANKSNKTDAEQSDKATNGTLENGDSMQMSQCSSQSTALEKSSHDNRAIVMNIDVIPEQDTVLTLSPPAHLPPPPPPPPPPCVPPPPPPGPPPPPPPPGSLPLPKSTTAKTAESQQVKQGSDKGTDGGTLDLSQILGAKDRLKKTVVMDNKTKVTNPMDDMMQLIRQGVKLRRVTEDTGSPVKTPSSEHTSKLEEVLERIRKNCSSSDDEGESEQDFSD